MATVRTLEFFTDMLHFPTSGDAYASSQGALEWTNGGNIQWIWTPSNTSLGNRIADLLIDTNDVTVRPNVEITDLSFSRGSAYWQDLQASGNLAFLLTDLLRGNDTIFGNNTPETLVGFDGNDIIIGGPGGDSLLGGSGNNTAGYQTAATAVRASLTSPGTNTADGQGDQYFGIANLIGSRFNDTLEGNAGANRLTGGLGRDRLEGNPGADVFDFNLISESKPGGLRDLIVDFSRSQNDRIDLKDIDAKTGISGNQAFKFIGKDSFNDVEGELRFSDNGANCIVQGDVNGDGRADFEIFVAEGTLSKSDFLL